jgi:hypothetical protein
MSIWLYPISEKAKRSFLLDDGPEEPVSVENYRRLVLSGRLAEDDWWYITQNYDKVKPGDEIYVYTGDQDLGIIGYATVLDKQGQDIHTWELNLRIDIDKCRMLIEKPIPAKTIRQWLLPGRIRTVRSLDPFQAELRGLVPWSPKGKPGQRKSILRRYSSTQAADIDEPKPPAKTTIKTTRVIRDTKASSGLKRLYDNACQLCGTIINLGSRDYSETHHLQPLGGNHNGPDVRSNMIVLCPNHHVEFDYGAVAIDPDTLEVIQANGHRAGKLTLRKGHSLEKRYLKYHLDHVFLKNKP